MFNPIDAFLGLFSLDVGIDLGTGSCKSVIIDAQAQLLGFGAGSYAKRESTGQWEAQDPQELLSAMIQSVRTAIQDAGVDPLPERSDRIHGPGRDLAQDVDAVA